MTSFILIFKFFDFTVFNLIRLFNYFSSYNYGCGYEFIICRNSFTGKIQFVRYVMT